MAVQPHRPLWTDERLDDLNQSMREGFQRNDTEHAEIRAEIRTMRSELKGEISGGFARQDQRFDALQRTLILGMVGLFTAMLAAVVTLATTLG